jgi:hypothetical protein
VIKAAIAGSPMEFAHQSLECGGRSVTGKSDQVAKVGRVNRGSSTPGA